MRNGETAIVLNADLISYYSNNKSIKALHVYAMAVFTMRQLGYMRKDVFLDRMSENLKVAKSTVYKWLEVLIEDGVITEKKGILYILGKVAYLKKLGLHSKANFKATWEDISSYKAFRNFCVIQSGIRLQNRFRYNLKKINKNTECPLMMERIEFPVSRDPKKVGCSSSYLAKHLGISKSSAASCLVGNTKKNFEYIKTIDYQCLAELYKSGYFLENYRVKCFIVNNRPTLYYSLSSTIISDSKFCRRGQPSRKNYHSYSAKNEK